MKLIDMNTRSVNTNKVEAVKPADEQFFIDRLVEILLMQVENNENEHGTKIKRILHRT